MSFPVTLVAPTTQEIPLNNILWKGWLSKAGARNKRWRKRYFCLTPTHMLYFENETLSVRKGTIPLFLCYGICAFNREKFCLLTLKRVWLLTEEDPHKNQVAAGSDSVPLISCLEALLPQCTILAQSWFKTPRPRYFGVLLSSGVFLRFKEATLDELYGWYEIHRVEYKKNSKIVLIQCGNSSIHGLALEDPTGSEAWTMLFESTVEKAVATWRRSKGGNANNESIEYGYDLDDVDDVAMEEGEENGTNMHSNSNSNSNSNNDNNKIEGSSPQEQKEEGSTKGSHKYRRSSSPISMTFDGIGNVDGLDNESSIDNNNNNNNNNNNFTTTSTKNVLEENNTPEVLLKELREALSGRFLRISPRICNAIRCGVPEDLRRPLWNSLSNAVNGGRRRTTVADGGGGGSTKGWRRGKGKNSTNQQIVRQVLSRVNGDALRAYMQVNERIVQYTVFQGGKSHVLCLDLICKRLLRPWLTRKNEEEQKETKNENGADKETKEIKERKETQETEKIKTSKTSKTTNTTKISDHEKEEDIFWLLTSIVEHLVPNLHDSAMQVQVESSVFCRLLKQREQSRSWKDNGDNNASPSSSSSSLSNGIGMRETLDKLGLDLRRIVMVWFSTLFLDAILPSNNDDDDDNANENENEKNKDNRMLMYRIMDEFLLDGWSVLYRVGLGFLAVNEKKLRNCTTADEALAILLPSSIKQKNEQDERNEEEKINDNNEDTVALLTIVSVGAPYVPPSIRQERPWMLNTTAPSDQWLRDARRPAWAEVHISVAGWRRRMEHRNAAVNSVMAICSNLIETMTNMWSSLREIVPSLPKSTTNNNNNNNNNTATTITNSTNSNDKDRDEHSNDPSYTTSTTASSSLMFGYNADTANMHLTHVHDELHDVLVQHMTECHVSARRAVCTSMATCELIDQAWDELCRHEEEARRRSEGYEGFVGVKEEQDKDQDRKEKQDTDQKYQTNPTDQTNATNESKNQDGEVYDPVLDSLSYGNFVAEKHNNKQDRVKNNALKLYKSIKFRKKRRSKTDIEREETQLQSQLMIMVDGAMSVAWCCAAACWSCKHWLGRDAWWSSTWTGHGFSMASSDAIMPRHLHGASITALNHPSSSTLSSSSSSTTALSGSSASKPFVSTNQNMKKIDLVSASSNVSSVLSSDGIEIHRKVCISMYDTFHSTASQIAKAIERLLRCDIAGQRTDGTSDGVTLKSELTGGASHEELASFVKKLAELRQSLELCKE